MSSDKDVGGAGASQNSLAEDVSSLRQDLTKMQEILTRFTSEAGGQAVRIGHTVASQVGSTASGIASTGADVATSVTQQFKTFSGELEDITRKNPFGALTGALVIGVVVGLIARGR